MALIALTAERIALLALAGPIAVISGVVIFLIREVRSIELRELGLKAGIRALARRRTR